MGGLARLAPEVLSFFDKRHERAHELKLQEYSLRLIQLQNEGRLAIVDREVERVQWESVMAAAKSQIEAQGRPSGVRWVDAWSASIRPAVTTWLFLLYTIYKTCMIYLAYNSGESLETILFAMWGPEDSAMLSSVLTFWFIGRVLDRIRQ